MLFFKGLQPIISLKTEDLELQKTNTSYNSSFTAGGLLHQEFLAIKSIITADNFLQLIDIEEQENRYIGIKSLGARKRIIPQIKARVVSVDPGFWDEFYTWSDKEQKLGLFYVSLKTYRLIFEIHWEVALKKFKTGDQLDDYSVTMFMDELASKNEDMASWSEKTFKKVNSRYRKALLDSGLMRGKKLIRPQGIHDSYWEYFKSNNENWFLEACFIR